MKNEFSLKYYFEEVLDSGNKDRIIAFLQQNQSASIEQDPDWYRINNPSKKVTHFYALQNEQVVCYCSITENKIIAQIHLGPVFSDPETLVSSIRAIRNYYLKKRFAQLEVQLGVNYNFDEIEYFLYNSIPFVQKFDAENWSTISLNIEPDIEEIFKSFKSNHKGSIKKALKENLKVQFIETVEDVKLLAGLYDKMYLARKLKKSFHDTFEVFNGLNNLFLTRNKGKILGVFTPEGKMIGGVIMGIHNEDMYYKYGISDPEFRKLPVLHLALFEAIKIAKNEGLKIFNFGGYNHFVGKDDQVYAINFFKRSFGGEFIYYPKRMYFTLNKMKFFIFRILKFVYQKINSFRK